jgi:ribonuclease P/MRP protein subunit POP5
MKNAKKSLNPIPLSLRGKKRYIAFALECDKTLNESAVSEAIWKSLLQMYGEIGTARQKPWLASYSKNQGVLRCAHNSVEEVKAGLLFVEKVGESRVIPRILKVSGSVKGAKN